MEETAQKFSLPLKLYGEGSAGLEESHIFASISLEWGSAGEEDKA